MTSTFSYPISAPVEFVNSTNGKALDFNCQSYASGDSLTQNVVYNFGTTSPGDLLLRNQLGTSNTLQRLPIGTPSQVLTVTGSTAVAEVTSITTVADVAGSLNNRYFLLNSPTTGYYVWYNVGGAGSDPINTIPTPSDLSIPAGSGHLRTAIVVAIATNATANAVATATASAINAVSTAFSAPAPGANVVTVTNVTAGVASDAANGAASPGFTISTPTPGVSPAIAWSTSPGSINETFLANATAVTAAAVAPGSTWVTVSNSVVTWNDSTLPNNDAGGIFNTTTGVVTIPTTGIYNFSAHVAFEANNSGNGGGGIPGRRAVRQGRIRNTTTNVTMAFSEIQCNGFSQNPTNVYLIASNLSLVAANTLVLQVRHDATASLALDITSETAVNTASVYFTCTRVA